MQEKPARITGARADFSSYSIERPPVFENFAVLIALLFEIPLTIAGLHELNVQPRMEQGR